MTFLQQKFDDTFQKIIAQYWQFILSQVKDKGKCVCVVKILAEPTAETNCIFHVYPSTHWNWQYNMSYSPLFSKIVEKYNPEEHILLSIQLPNKFIENVLNMHDISLATTSTKLFSKLTSLEVAVVSD